MNNKTDTPTPLHSEDSLISCALKIGAMMAPVRCNHCRRVYDLTKTEVIHRYADCTLYTTPCCARQVDDRPAGSVSSPAFTRLSREEIEAARHGEVFVDEYGNFRLPRIA
jgi:hypothetical protein